MATLVFGMNQSLDGYVDHDRFAPGPDLFRWFVEEAQRMVGSVYGRKMYETMRYWDDEDPEWGEDEWTYAEAWRRQPKWVVSRTLATVGPNATLIDPDRLEETVREIKAAHEGEIEVAGPELAGDLLELGLVDEVQIYLHPVVLGHGRPLFNAVPPPLRLLSHEQMPGDVLRLRYAPG